MLTEEVRRNFWTEALEDSHVTERSVVGLCQISLALMRNSSVSLSLVALEKRLRCTLAG